MAGISFNNLSSETVDDANRKSLIVYVEDNFDELIFDRWFPESEHQIKFRSVSSDRSSGGCENVIAAVKERIDNPNLGDISEIYWGIVDRDALFSNRGTTKENKTRKCLFWQEDDDTFFDKMKDQFKQTVILNHWEIENYFLDVGTLTVHFLHDLPIPKRNKADLKNVILQALEKAHPFILRRTAGRILQQQFCCKTSTFEDNRDDHTKLENSFICSIANQSEEKTEEDIRTLFEELKSKLSPSEFSEENWPNLVRFLDGKVGMRDFIWAFQNLKEQIPFQKAINKIRESFYCNSADKGCDDPYLNKMVNYLKKQRAS